MRTTIEIADDKLRRLREMAARRGEKGYSKIIDEALEAYLEGASLREVRTEYDAKAELTGALLAPLLDYPQGTRAANTLERILEARRRPEGGFGLHTEASMVEFALKNPGESAAERSAAILRAAGTLTDEEADRLQEDLRESRKRWRAS